MFLVSFCFKCYTVLLSVYIRCNDKATVIAHRPYVICEQDLPQVTECKFSNLEL